MLLYVQDLEQGLLTKPDQVFSGNPLPAHPSLNLNLWRHELGSGSPTSGFWLQDPTPPKGLGCWRWVGSLTPGLPVASAGTFWHFGPGPPSADNCRSDQPPPAPVRAPLLRSSCFLFVSSCCEGYKMKTQ